MNRRQKIIVSVVGIFIVLLALVGITYGYFLTRIQGNTNTTSITVTTADLKLVYGDGNSQIITKTEIMPDTVIGTKDFTVTNSGNTATEYAVTIEDIIVTYTTSGTTKDNEPYNAGDKTSFVSEDFEYTLTCTSVNTETGIETGTCNGVEKAMLPMSNSILVENDIPEEITHKYEITVKYLETNKDQSEDMNKTFNAKINIGETKNTWDEARMGTLLYALKNDNEVTEPTTNLGEPSAFPSESGQVNDLVVKIKYSELKEFTTYPTGKPFTSCQAGSKAFFEPAARDIEIQSCDDENEIATVLYNYWADAYIFKESTLARTEDDYGTSYYFRGSIENNYVNYANMCWRIVRVDGNGNIKITLADENGLCDADTYSKNNNTTAFINNATLYNFGSSSSIGYFESFKKSLISNLLNNWVNDKITDQSDLVETEWCNDLSVTSITIEYMTIYNYGSYNRLENKTPTLKCNMTGVEIDGVISESEKYQNKIGLLTADETVFAGGSKFESNNYFLLDNAKSNIDDPYNLNGFWLMSPSRFGAHNYSMIYYVSKDGSIVANTPDGVDERYVRPAVVLNSNVKVTTKSNVAEFGKPGTQKNPYVVS